jgi:hypothetical protein
MPVGARMSLFDWLLVTHLVADFLFQTDSMAKYKGQDWLWMFKHVGLYMIIMSILLIVYGLLHALPAVWVAAALAFILATHLLLDRRTFTRWWMRLIGISNDKLWISVVVDQVFHVVTLAIVAQVLVLAGR